MSCVLMTCMLSTKQTVRTADCIAKGDSLLSINQYRLRGSVGL